MTRAAAAFDDPASRGTARPRGPRIVASLLLATVALGLGLMALLPWLAHRTAMNWPVVRAAVLSRTVVATATTATRASQSYIVRDTYRATGASGPSLCHWDDPLGTGIRRWIDARVQTRDRHWPVGSEVPVRAEPYGDRCEPVGGFERAVRPTVGVVALAALACLGGLALLWRPATAVR